MPTVEAFCSRGFFPKELPPPFKSTTFGTLTANPKLLPNAFNDTNLKCNTFRYSLARSGEMRRTLHIMNPIVYFNLSKCIVANWKTIAKHLKRSGIGLSHLVDVEDTERALKRYRLLEHLPRERAVRFASSRYVFKSDIMRFFPSIYTHSIPWALHSKGTAKKRRFDDRLLGNQLDKLIRNAQDQQTMGIPIGPDTSHIVAEILLSTVDYQLSKRHKLTGFRYVDDYELGFPNISEAELCGNELQSILSEYELELSTQKTKIIELPHQFEETWATELRSIGVSKYSKSQHYQLMYLFNRSFELFHEDKTRNVLRYAISRIKNIPISQRNWKEFQGILCQCMLAEPGTLRFAIDRLWKHVRLGYQLDKDLVVNTLASIIRYHSPLSHDSEVCWSLWAAILLEAKLDYRTTKLLLNTEQTCIMLLLLDGIRKGLFSSKLDVSGWKTYISKDELYSKYWLLTYENAATQWIRTNTTSIRKDPRFGFLLQNGVRFYNENASSEYTPPKKHMILYDVSG